MIEVKELVFLRCSLKRLNMDIKLIGSRLFNCERVDSDWDLLLICLDLSLNPGIRTFCNTKYDFFSRASNAYNFHKFNSDLSQQLLCSLGGESRIASIKNVVFSIARPHFQIPCIDRMDLFLYVPPEISDEVWAIRLTLSSKSAEKDLGVRGRELRSFGVLKRSILNANSSMLKIP